MGNFQLGEYRPKGKRMESMKMEQTIVSSADGVIESLNVSEGETIEVGSVMLVIR